MLPHQILFVWLRGLLSVALVLLGIYLLREWYERSHVWEAPRPNPAATAPATPDAPPARPAFRFDPGLNAPTALLVGGLLSLALPLGGGLVIGRLCTGRPGRDEPRATRGGDARRVTQGGGGGVDGGRELQVEAYGRADGIPVVLTHGLGADSTQWFYAKRELGDACRVTVWDVPGLGLSPRPANDDYALGALAGDLRAVVQAAYEGAGNRPVVLVGHSMGGMIQLEFCKRFPEELGTTVAGIVQVDSSYTNPLRTTRHSGLYTALQKPLVEPLLHLTVWLSPLVRAMMVMGYVNGSTPPRAAARSPARNRGGRWTSSPGTTSDARRPCSPATCWPCAIGTRPKRWGGCRPGRRSSSVTATRRAGPTRASGCSGTCPGPTRYGNWCPAGTSASSSTTASSPGSSASSPPPRSGAARTARETGYACDVAGNAAGSAVTTNGWTGASFRLGKSQGNRRRL